MEHIFETIQFATRDGIIVAGDFYEADGNRGVLLLHMMPAARKSWIDFAKKLQEAGFQVLAIDLRGHGESQGGPDGYKNFSDAEHQASRFDVIAAIEFLQSRGVIDFHLVGASIGANLALQYAAEHPEVKSVVLLSPGINYRGVRTDGLVRGLDPGQSLYLVSGGDGDAASRETVSGLIKETLRGPARMLKIFDDAEHGTRIFEKHPEFMDELIVWIKTSSNAT